MDGNGLHVLQVIKGLDIGGHSGGAEHFGLRLSRQLSQNGVNVSLCAFYRFNTPVEADWVERLESEGIKVVFANQSPKLDLIEAYRSIGYFCRKNRVSILHSHFQVGTIAGLLLKIFGSGPRVIRTAHFPLEFGKGWVSHLARLIFVQGLYAILIDDEAGYPRFLVEALNARTVARWRGRRAILIYNSLDSPQIEPLTTERKGALLEGISPSSWIITSVGVLEERKNFDMLIQAMPPILEKIPDARLLIAGDGAQKEKLQQLINRLGLNGKVQLLGQRSDVTEILRQSKLFVLASSLEALPTVILEAMQAGVPVVASSIPGNCEIIEQRVNGWLFPLKNQNELVHRIVEAYTHPGLCKQFVEESRRRLKMFTIQSAAEQYVYLYENPSGRRSQ